MIHGITVGNYHKSYVVGVADSIAGDKDKVLWIIKFRKGTAESEIKQFCEDIGIGCSWHSHPERDGGIESAMMKCTKTELDNILENLSAEDLKYVEHIDSDQPIGAQVWEDHGSSQGTYQWGLDRINQRNLPLDRDSSFIGAGSGVHVYVLDTGVRTTHQEFGGRALPTVESMGTPVECNPTDISCARGGHYHGTHCAGTIAGSTWGVAKAATIRAVQVLDNGGYGWDSWTLEAVEWVAVHAQADPTTKRVVSMSLGSIRPSSPSPSTIASHDALNNMGVVVVVAAGNQNADACAYSPAGVASSITVGSTVSDDSRSSFSNYGPCTNIYAPGSRIISADNYDDIGSRTASGTSMATPHVAGVVAVMLKLKPSLSTSEVRDILIKFSGVDKVFDRGSQHLDNNFLLFSPDSTTLELPQAPSVWSEYPDKNCYQANGKGATNVHIQGSDHGRDCKKNVASADACKDLCLQSDGCDAVVYFYTFCCARTDVDLTLCDTDGPYTTYILQ